MAQYKKWHIIWLLLLLILPGPVQVQGSTPPVLTVTNDILTATWEIIDEEPRIGILAVYSENGALLDCVYEPLKTPALSLKLPKSILDSAGTLCKAMLWDARTLSPVCQPAVCTLKTLCDTPFPISFTSFPGKMVVQFQNAGAGLQVDGLRANGTFLLCGADGKYYDARACITAFDTVTIYGRGTEVPIGIRYEPGRHPTAGALTSVHLTPVQAFTYCIPELP